MGTRSIKKAESVMSKNLIPDKKETETGDNKAEKAVQQMNAMKTLTTASLFLPEIRRPTIIAPTVNK